MQARSVRTRQRIILATAQAINDRSFDRSSLSRIAADAGVTTGAFYFHFSSKEDAALAVMNTQNEYSQTKALHVSAWDRPALELMLITSSGIMRDIVQDPIVRAGVRLAAEIGLLDTFPTPIWQSWIDNNVAQLTAAQGQGDIRSDAEIAAAAELLVTSIIGIFLLCSLERDIPSLQRRVHGMWRQFIHAYATDSPRWLSVAETLFDSPAPAPLTLAEIQQRHSGDLKPEAELSAETSRGASTS